MVVVRILVSSSFLHLTRGTAVQHVRGVAADGAPLSVSEPQFPLIVTMMTGAWLGSGNRVDVMLNGDGTFARLWEDHSIALSATTPYCLAPPPP